MQFHPVVTELFNTFDQELKLPQRKDDDDTSRAISTLAVLYEKARNALEYKAEHFVRRSAIERILKRRILTDKKSGKIAQNLVVELLWAKYIDSSFLEGGKQGQIERVINRYLNLREQLSNDTDLKYSWDMFMGAMAAEIDELIVAPTKREALIKFFYLTVRSRIVVPDMPEEKLDLCVYVCAEKALVQADEKLITFHLLKMSVPQWFGNDEAASRASGEHILTAFKFVKAGLNDKTIGKIFPFVRNQLPTILVTRDFLLNTKNPQEIAQDPEVLEKTLTATVEKAYNQTSTTVRRAVARSFVYIFLTKMLFALALELPYDLYITKDVVLLPLAVNSLFPLALLILLSIQFRKPSRQNTRKLVEKVSASFYDFETFAKSSKTYTPQINKRPLLTTAFYVLYLAAFGLTFGFINTVLLRLNFNFVSRIIFVFFLALVSFFAYHIRSTARQYQLENRQGIIASLTDFFFLPILRAGQILSGGIAKLNMFVFIFDFILEAPLKSIFEVLEEWFRFIRAKREEII